MKRKILFSFLILIACFTAVSFGQRRSGSTVQKIIQLTKPSTSGGKYFQEILANLRANDRFTGQPIDKNMIGQLAWAGLGNRVTPGITSVIPRPLESPFPTQLYIVANDGVFYYQPLNHTLEQIAEGDARLTLASATAMPAPVSSAGCIIIITSNVTRNTSSARRGNTPTSNRSAMLLEAGHIAQNIQLQAACEDGLGSITISAFEETNVSKICNLPRGSDVLYMVCIGYTADQGNTSSSTVTPKRAAIIVPGENFEDAEFFETLNTLNNASIQTVVASNRVGPIRGMRGGLFEVQVLANALRLEDFDAIVVIGGAGSGLLLNDSVVLNIIGAAFQQRKIIGATSTATLVLAKAGILRGIKVACTPELSTELTLLGAVPSNARVEEQMRVITCSDPQVARPFATSLADGILAKK